ncbi:MAG TPA: endonuclease/exonuclease/phosphatase family protein, partial [Paludibacter sp.]
MKQLVLLIVFFVSAQSIMAHKVTFMTYNVLNYDGLNFQIFRIPKHAQIISASGADVVAVQEISGNSNFNSLKDKTGMSGSWFDIAGNGYGIGVLWKASLGTPVITNVKVDPVSGSSDSESRAFIVAEFTDFCFIATHFSLNDVDRDSMVVQIIKHAQTAGKTVFVGGDLNAKPTYRALVTLQNNNFKILNTLSDYTYPADNPTLLIDMILGYRNNSTDKEYTVISRGIPTAPSGVTYSDVSDHLPYCVTVD